MKTVNYIQNRKMNGTTIKHNASITIDSTLSEPENCHKRNRYKTAKGFSLALPILIFVALFLTEGSLHNPLFAQEEPIFVREDNSRLSRARILRGFDKVSVPQVSVMFKHTTKRSIYKTERSLLGASRSGGGAVSADLTAYLVFSDEEPTSEEYQKLVNEFYDYLLKKFNEANIQTFPWETFASSNLYTQFGGGEESDSDMEEFRRGGNAWMIVNAWNGPRVVGYNPVNHRYTAPAVRGTTRMSNYLKDTGAEYLAILHLTVDFADIYLDGDVRTGTTQRAFSSTQWGNYEVKYDLWPNIKITSRENGGNNQFIFPTNRKFMVFHSNQDVKSGQPLNAQVSQDAEKIKRSSWLPNIYIGQRFDIDPFVVETTKAEYLSQVKLALERYADALVRDLVAVR